MKLTVDAAGLLAQVIPTLLVVVALEPSFRTFRPRSSAGKWFSTKGRESAAVVALGATALCLWVVFSGKEHIAATVGVILGASYLLLIMAGLFAMMFAQEDTRAERND